MTEARNEPTFDKFAWLKKLSADDSLTGGQRRLATFIATECTWKNGKGWAVELSTIAAASGYKNAVTLNRALRRLTQDGYLVETYRRNTGPGLPAKASFNLNTDTVENTDTGNTDTNTDTETNNTDTEKYEHRHRKVRTPALKSTNTGTLQSSQTIPEQEKQAPQGVLSGIPSGNPCLVTKVPIEDVSRGPLGAARDKHGEEKKPGEEELNEAIERHRLYMAALIAKGKEIGESGKYWPKPTWKEKGFGEWG